MNDAGSKSWSTADLPPADQFAYWSEMICHSFVSLTPSFRAANRSRPPEAPGFLGSVEQRPLGGIYRSHIQARAQLTRRTRRDIGRDDGEFYFLNLQLTGECRAEQNHQLITVSPGDYVVLDARQPYELDFPEDWSMLSYRLPASWLDPYRSTTSAPMAPASRGAVHQLLASTLRGLWNVSGGPAEVALTQSLSSLVAATWAATPSLSQDELLRRRILERMAAELADPDTTVTSIARQLHISVRTLHSAFEGTQTSAAQALRQLRMSRAQSLLAQGKLSTAAVGRAVGYPHPSSFARAFKSTIGHAPRNARPELH